MAKFLLHETGVVPKEVFATDNVPEKYREDILKDLQSTSSKREIPLYFEADAGKAQELIRKTEHKGKGLILGSGWDKKLANEKDMEFLSVAVPSPVRLVLTTNYAGFSGGLRLIEDIYGKALDGYVK